MIRLTSRQPEILELKNTLKSLSENETVERIDVLRSLSRLYNITGEYKLGLDCLKKILKLNGLLKGTDLAAIHGDMGNIYINQAIYNKAQKHIEKGIKALNGNDNKEKLRLYNLKSTLLLLKGDFHGCAQLCKDLISDPKNTVASKEMASVYRLLGNANSNLGNYEGAMDCYNKAMEIYKSMNDNGGEAMTLGSMGTLYHKNFEYLSALKFYYKSLSIFKKIGDYNNYAITLMNIGNICRQKGDYTKAYKYYNASLVIGEKIGNTSHIAKASNCLAVLFLSLGNLKKAEESIQSSIKISKKDACNLLRMHNYFILGIIKQKLGEFEDAGNFFNKSLKINTEIGSRREAFFSKLYLANLYCEKGEYPTSTKLLDESLSIAKNLKSHEFIAQASFIKGKIEARKSNGNKNIAMNIFDRTLKLYLERYQKEFIWEIYYEIGRLYQNEKRFYEAFEYLNKAKQAMEEIYSNLPDDLRNDYLDDIDRQKVYRDLVFVKSNLAKDEKNIDKPAVEAAQENGFDELIGNSPKFLELIGTAKTAATGNVTVLIQGATGTGKELMARFIHMNSKRKDKPFIPINCTALPQTLIESELFGHEQGAFTDAVEKRIGKLESARGGTIFLDDVESIPLDIQAKLLRFLQEKEFTRVGGNELIKVDVRVICSTKKDLLDEIKTGRFRDDLYYRINVFPINIPSLKERPEDIALLANYFLMKSAKRLGKNIRGFSSDAMRLLCSYDFPGNVHELKNLIQRAAMLTKDNGRINSSTLMEHINWKWTTQINKYEAKYLEDAVDRMELEMIKEALEVTNGNVTKAAEALGLSRRGLYKKMERFGME